MPNTVAGRVGLSSLRIYVAGSNVFTWSDLKSIVPPEANPGSTRATYYYQTRNFSFGTSLGF